MVADPAADETVPACLASLEASLTGGSASLADFSQSTLETALDTLVRKYGDEALSLATTLAESSPRKEVRKAARRVLYRLTPPGVTLRRAVSKPVVERQAEKALRAWVSGVDGTGSRAIWIVFQGSLSGLALCALIANDQAGLLDVAGGAISKKRLERELRGIRENQKLPWLEIDPERARGLVAEALALHERIRTELPPDFSRWRRLFTDIAAAGAPVLGSLSEGDETLREHSRELLDLPELASWFLDPGALQSEALELLQAKESRLVLSDQQKAEREAAIVDRVVDRAFPPEVRGLWARRLAEMAWIFEATGRARETDLARAAARALEDSDRSPRHLPFARGLAERGLAVASEVALGRVSAAEVSRAPRK